VYRKCSSCVECASVQGQGNPGRPPLKSIVIGGPFECIGMDFLELDTAKSGSKYALVFLQDYLSKWLEVYPVKDYKAETVARCLLDLMWRHGVLARIIHDRAAEFMSDALQETAGLMGLEQLPTSSSGGHPQTDGLVERFNRTSKQMLAKLVSKGGRDWDELLGPVLFTYRTTPHSSTGEVVLVYGRDARMPTSQQFSLPTVRYPVVAT